MLLQLPVGESGQVFVKPCFDGFGDLVKPIRDRPAIGFGNQQTFRSRRSRLLEHIKADARANGVLSAANQQERFLDLAQDEPSRVWHYLMRPHQRTSQWIHSFLST